VSFQPNARFWVVLSVAIVALLILQQFWHWEVERVEVPAGQFLVRIHRWGKDLASEQLLAPNDSYKGVMEDPVPEGRNFLNPLFWSYELHPMVTVPTGKALVLTRTFGRPISKARLAAGEILAGDGECGILEEVLKPGSYRINPYAYSWSLVDAVEVHPDQVGVRTLRVGKDPRTIPAEARVSRYVVPDGYRGVQKNPVKSGTYYINPYVETIVPVEVRNHRAELTDIQFPTRDGFTLKPKVLISYAVQADKAPELFVRLSDHGQLHQGDATPKEQEDNEILQKIILPHIRGWVRIEGSNMDATDFIETKKAATGEQKVLNNREQLQRTLMVKIEPQCQALGINILELTLGEMESPRELADQINARETLRVQLEANKSTIVQLKSKQQNKATEATKQQYQEKVAAETRLKQATIKAEQRKQVAELGLKTALKNAELELEAARNQVKAILAKGQAEADVVNAQNEAEVAALRRAAQGFDGVQHFAQYHLLSKVGPALAEIFASDDSELAKLFATYMTPPPSAGSKPSSAAPGVPSTSSAAR
jgi:hypothetical protein